MKRREFITLLGGATVGWWPLAARAQQSAMPMIGFLDGRSPDATMADRLRAFREGLKDTGYVEGDSAIITYRWAENQLDRLPELAVELIRRRVTVIAAPSTTAAVAAKAATATIPIVFLVGDDPVKLGLVTSLGRPGGNATGINFVVAELGAKRLELLHELVPTASRIAVLVNPTDQTRSNVRDLEAAARAVGLQIHVFSASTTDEIDMAFAGILRERMQALILIPDAYFGTRRVQVAIMAARHALPTVAALRSGAVATDGKAANNRCIRHQRCSLATVDGRFCAATA